MQVIDDGMWGTEFLVAGHSPVAISDWPGSPFLGAGDPAGFAWSLDAVERDWWMIRLAGRSTCT